MKNHALVHGKIVFLTEDGGFVYFRVSDHLPTFKMENVRLELKQEVTLQIPPDEVGKLSKSDATIESASFTTEIRISASSRIRQREEG